MSVRTFLGMVFASLLLSGPADAGYLVAVDEFGSGIGTIGGGFLASDPGPGGLDNVLTYNLPFAGTQGDVFFGPESGTVFGGDVIRFGGNGTLIIYSDSNDGADAPGDTPHPPTTFYPNVIMTGPEIGPEGNNYVIYTPLPGQPGYDPVFQPTYFFQSDGVLSIPEPPSLAMGGTAALAGLGYVLRHRKRVTA